jgi:hypothetical protein
MPQTLKWPIVLGLQGHWSLSLLHKAKRPATLKLLRNERDLSD